jgi:hypothetical protein
MEKSDIDYIVEVKDRVLYAIVPVVSISFIACISWVAS